MYPREVDGDHKGNDHGCDFGAGGNAPPEPPEDEQSAGPGPEQQQQIEGLSGRGQGQAQRGTGKQGQDRGPSAGAHLLLFGRIRTKEPHPDVVDEVARAEVDLGAHRGDESRKQGGRHPAEQAGGQQAEHGRIGDIVPHLVRCKGREGRGDAVEVGEDDEGRQGDQNPWPRSEGIMGCIEQQRGPDGVLFAAGAEHSLGDVSASTGFGPRIITRPPLYGERNEEDRNPHFGVIKIRPDGQLARDVRMGQQFFHAPHLRQVHHVKAGGHGPAHGEHELEKVGPQDGPQPAIGAEEQSDAARHAKGHPPRPTEQDAPQLDGGQADGGHHKHIEHQPQIDGAEAPEEGAPFAAIAQFVEFNVSKDAGAAPELGIDEDGHHARQEESPPGPIARHTLLAHEVRDEVRRVRAERGGHHGRAEQPPGHGASAEEIIVGIAFSFPT